VADVVRETDMFWDPRQENRHKVELRRKALAAVKSGKSTPLPRYWVRPSWVREMKKMYKFGVQTFYRRAPGVTAAKRRAGERLPKTGLSARLAEARTARPKLSDRISRR